MVLFSSVKNVSFNIIINFMVKKKKKKKKLILLKHLLFVIKIMVVGNVLVTPTDVWFYCFCWSSDPISSHITGTLNTHLSSLSSQSEQGSWAALWCLVHRQNLQHFGPLPSQLMVKTQTDRQIHYQKKNETIFNQVIFKYFFMYPLVFFFF